MKTRYFKDKTVYITGGSSGIGLDIAKLLLKLGANLVLLARNKEKLNSSITILEKAKVSIVQKLNYLSVDVSHHQSVETSMKEAVSRFGEPDILICSAGILKYGGTFDTIGYLEFDELIKINFYGVRNIIHSLLEPLKSKKGQIVIISSAAGLFGMYGYTAYSASKAALVGLAESLRYELKPLGMQVKLVCPAEVDTPMIEGEDKTLPPEGQAMKKLPGTLDSDYVARKIVKAMRKQDFLVIPGFRAPLMYFLHRLTNGKISRIVSDLVIKITRAKMIVQN